MAKLWFLRPCSESARASSNDRTASTENGQRDFVEWELFTPDELSAMGHQLGLETILLCAAFDEAIPTTSDIRDFQIVFEKQ